SCAPNTCSTRRWRSRRSRSSAFVPRAGISGRGRLERHAFCSTGDARGRVRPACARETDRSLDLLDRDQLDPRTRTFYCEVLTTLRDARVPYYTNHSWWRPAETRGARPGPGRAARA